MHENLGDQSDRLACFGLQDKINKVQATIHDQELTMYFANGSRVGTRRLSLHDVTNADVNI